MTDAAEPSAGNVAARLWICVTCRRGPVAGGGLALATDGRELYDAVGLVLDTYPQAHRVDLRWVECMSSCGHACNIALNAPAKATYLFGDLEPTPHNAEAVVECAMLYADQPDGVLRRVDLPGPLRRGLLARIPAVPVE